MKRITDILPDKAEAVRGFLHHQDLPFRLTCDRRTKKGKEQIVLQAGNLRLSLPVWLAHPDPQELGDKATLEVPDDCTRDQALDALEQLRQDLGFSKLTLSGSEIDRLETQGRAAVKAPLEIPHRSADKLREFVKDYCAGQIYTIFDVPPDLISMVFVPWAWSDDPKELKNLPLPLDPGPEPAAKLKAPEAPHEPKLPDQPPLKPLVQPDPQQVRQLKLDISWHVKEPAALKAYQQEVREINQGIKQENDQVLATWKQACQKIQQQHKAALRRYSKAQQAFEAEQRNIEGATQTWQTAQDRYHVARAAAKAELYRDYGCIYGDVKDAFPRSINGYPMFHTVGALHRDDWERAKKAILKFQKMEQELEI